MSIWQKTTILVLVFGLPALAYGTPFSVMTDMNKDGDTNVADITCSIATTLASAQDSAPPLCLKGSADLDCDSVQSVADIQLVLLAVLNVGIPEAFDINGNETVDRCEALCALSGNAGETVICPVHLARADVDVPEPYGFNLNISVGEPSATLLGASPTGIDIGLGVLPDTGNTFVVSDGGGGLNLTSIIGVNWGLENPMSSAYLDGEGSIVGDSHIADIMFELLHDVSDEAPILALTSQLMFTSSASQAWPGRVEQEHLVMGACDLDYECTTSDPCSLNGCLGTYCELGDAPTGTVCFLNDEWGTCKGSPFNGAFGCIPK